MDENRSKNSTSDTQVTSRTFLPSQVMGLNDNIKFLGRELHVQTEAARIPMPHIVTHVFSNGRILLSRKSDCPVDIDEASSQQRIRELMQLQHQDVINELLKKQQKVQKDEDR